MKKTLAIVLALVMVLCMIPAMSADTTKTITDKSYTIIAESYGDMENNASHAKASESKANSLTLNYNYEVEKADVTGRFTEDKKMALVSVVGFDTAIASADEITIDGRKLDTDSSAAYANQIGFYNNAVTFPIELTKDGYTDTFLITVKGKNANDNTETITETAKITLKMVNKAAYKPAKTATITNVVADSKFNDKVDAYIVGSKIYLDYYTKTADPAIVKFTFADENGRAFSAVTWASNPSSKKVSLVLKDNQEQKLDKSAAPYYFNGNSDSEIVFKLETASSKYETKKYDLVIRTGVVETDPKGIYFAESVKTIAIGEKYSPVVMGVATGRAVDATLVPGSRTDLQVIDVDGDTVTGTREGTAYITASYQTKNMNKPYTSSSMKIIVTANAVDTTVPPVDGTTTKATYTVTASSLNVRRGPGTSYAKAGSLPYGSKVEVVEIANGWAKLANGTYVNAGYLRADNATTTPGASTTMYVTCRTLNVRKGPGTSYGKAGTLSRNAAVEVVSVSNGWAKLSNGTYVSYKYLTK